MNIYRAYDIGNTVIPRNTLTNAQTQNIQAIFNKFVNVNKRLVKYSVPTANQNDIHHLLVRLNTKIFSVDEDKLDNTTIDSELLIIADRLLESETTKSSDGTKRSQSIKEGLLFLHLTNAEVTIVKLETSELIDVKSFAIQRGFGTSKEYLKTAVFKKDNFHDIDVMDKSTNIAKYWAEKFLGLQRIRTNQDNTKTVIDKIDDNTIFNPSLTKLDEFPDIKDQVLNFIASKKDFSMDSLFASISNAQKLNLDMSSVFIEDNANSYDDSFLLDQKIINNRFKKTFVISDSITVQSQNLRKDLKDGYFSVKGGFFRIKIDDDKEEQLKLDIGEGK
ncbi:hypothetical protein [Leuconostoc mesenteroides]|uniref:hypothetical protein n=1 Tax=Leuconostoc mesenteroides TaxID=1245 RepID=UPI0023616BFE|nr:hypothetical protein [Leuconostoc mesenteroides]